MSPTGHISYRVGIGRSRFGAALLVALLSTALFSSGLVSSASAQERDDLMEVFWEFRYSGLVNTVIGSRFDGERFYVSMGDVFGALNVNVIQEPEIKMARGFYLQTNRKYEIDFNAGRAFLGNTEIRFDSTDFVGEQLGFFLSQDLFQRLFNLSITLNDRNLTMTLVTPDEMPVIAEYRRKSSRVIRDETNFFERNAPLLFDRSRSVVNGGVFGYRLSTQMVGLTPRASLNLRGGGELFGGDLEMGVTGDYGTATSGATDFSFNLDNWRWRYVLKSLPALRQAQVGRLTSDGLQSFAYVGTRLSNDPVDVQRFFGSYPMRIQSEPGWEIEIYINNQLMDVRTADAAGISTFAVPITYGSTTIIVREYGPSGEFNETERRIEVPFAFVPPGEIRYNLFAGRGTTDDRNLIQATTSVGITNWLTAKWGFDYVTPDSNIAGEELANLSWGSVSARIGPSYILTARAAPGALYSGSLSVFYPSMMAFTLEYTQFGDNRIYNRSRQLHESRASASIPLRVAGIPISWRTNLSERRVSEDRYSFSASQDLAFQPGVLRINLGFRGNGTFENGEFLPGAMSLEPRFGYSFARAEGVPKPLRGLLVSLRTSYNVRTSELISFSANFSRTIARRIRLQTDVTHQVQTNLSSVNFRLALDLSSVRTTSGAIVRSSGEPQITQDFSGSLSYDGGSRRLDLSDRDWVGRAAATIRMFVDFNGDGTKGPEEPYIEHGGVDFKRTVSTSQGDNGFIIAYNLQAYEQYNVTVNQSRIRNPFWVPKFEEFSFITDPNVHKIIDVPFYVTGELSGSVLRMRGDTPTAVPGLKLHIQQKGGTRTWQESIFSDGSFYKIGLPPGDYRAWVDSSQMGTLRTVSDPPVREFTVAVTELGDAVDGIDFILRDVPRGQQPAPEPVVPEERPEVVEPDVEEPVRPVPDVEEPVRPVPQRPDDVREDVQEKDAEAKDAAREEAIEAVPADEPEAAIVYIVPPGIEGLRELARLVYGDESLWPKIWLANLDVIEDPGDLRSGQRLIIPPKAPLTPVEKAAGAGYNETGAAVPKVEEPTPVKEEPTPVKEEVKPEPVPAPQQEAPKEEARRDEPEVEADIIHTVVRSDVSLMNLARKYYNDGFLWPKIWVANRDQLPRPEAMEVGMELKIPPKAPLTPEERSALDAYNSGR